MINAHTLTLDLGGTWYGTYGTAPCPICQPEARKDQNALSLKDRDARLLLKCKKADCAFRDIAAALGIRPGTFARPDPATVGQREAECRAEDEKRSAQARAIWKGALPIKGTVAETYLRGRGIDCDLPETLRFHPDCWHTATSRRWPALVALVDGGKGFAVHRTYLRADGTGKADLKPQKAMLGPTAGGAVRLACAPGRLVVAEGIETALSLLCGLLDGPASVWAALSAPGLRALRLPSPTEYLTIAEDGEVAGYEAARALAERAHKAGWRVDILHPGAGRDFNDVLQEGSFAC